MHRSTIRQAFRRPMFFPVKVTPQAFEIDRLGEFKTLRGRVVKVTLVRKLFEDGLPVCLSNDGVRAENGTLCESCQHPRCRPRLRIQLGAGQTIYIIDLAVTSAQNFFAVEDRIELEGRRLDDQVVDLSVVDHDTWGEVVFELVEPSLSENDTAAAKGQQPA